jgi:hypothetical protein
MGEVCADTGRIVMVIKVCPDEFAQAPSACTVQRKRGRWRR